MQDEDPLAVPTAPLPEDPLREGRNLGGRYRLEHLLGRGGMGDVWRAYDLRLCVEVALKSLRRDLLGDAERREMLRREVRAARTVLSPHVCRIFDLVEADGQELLSMEYVDGDTLLEMLRRRAPLELREASRIAAQLLAGVEATHTAGLVHRDLKPDNVMITRSGRVVIMDLGVARSLTATGTGTITGTPAYMAPEQSRGLPTDARADVFSVAIVLAQLVTPGAMRNKETLGAFLEGLRDEPPRLPDVPWKPVLQRALAFAPEERYASAAALARALQEATQRATGPAERSPYPGLTAFTEADTDYFFGREVEVESVWKKLLRLHLLAVVGPSGAGKSSFLRAGLLPALPEGWSSLLCTPGASPIVALGQALAPQLAGDADTLRDFLRFQEPEVAAGFVARWRQRYNQVLLVVDQFEELFTLNPVETQTRFAGLLGRLAVETDVHVLLCMRDDFLFRCHEHPSLGPIFSELTPLGPLRGTDLQRALTLPAVTCGYRFEDPALVDEMLSQVAAERGALPLLAFAASRLWELRDRDRGLLTREAYARIGGVAGALAQHADTTFESISAGRQLIIRDLFRNLVTAEGTRVVWDREQLLSAYEDREAASQVLDELIDARLLTSFEVEGGTDSAASGKRIEIIHESLLEAWPRLARWRVQDAEGAQLRGQLRQAAQLWRERERPPELLWTGTLYREFAVWRERYPGGLTDMEEEFCRAMMHGAQQMRRRRRLLVTWGFAALASVLAVVGTLWQRSRSAEARAVAEARRAEASKLLTLAQTSPQPWDALAYVIASLDLADQPDARRQAIELLYRGPTMFHFSHVPDGHNPWTVEFSPDERWLALGWSMSGRLQLHSMDGGPPRDLAGHRAWIRGSSFSADSRYLATGADDGTLIVSDLAGPEPVQVLHYEATPWPRWSRQLDAFLVCETVPGKRPRWWAVTPATGLQRELGHLGAVVHSDYSPPVVDGSGAQVAILSGNQVFLHGVSESGFGPPRQVGRHESNVVAAAFDRNGNSLATVDASNRIHVWTLDGSTRSPDFILQGGDRTTGICFDRSGDRLAVGCGDGLRLWDLKAPAWMGPTLLARGQWVFTPDFHPSDQWIVASGSLQTVYAWPLGRPHRIAIPLEGPTGAGNLAWTAFSPDGRWLATSRNGIVHLWPLEAGSSVAPRELLRYASLTLLGLTFDPSGRTVFTSGTTAVADAKKGKAESGILIAIRIDTGETKIWRDPPCYGGAIDFDPTGRFVACEGGRIGLGHTAVFDLTTGLARTIRVRGMSRTNLVGFASDGTLIVETEADMYAWDLATDSSRALGIRPDWLSQPLGSPGVFAWRDSAGTYWLGDPVRGQPRALPIPADGRNVWEVAVEGDKVVAGYDDGTVELRTLGDTTGPPHMLLGHGKAPVVHVAIDPLGRWVASADVFGHAFLWPMPGGTPLQALPQRELLAKIRSLTNLRAVPDSTSVNGYAIEADPFPGWQPLPIP